MMPGRRNAIQGVTPPRQTTTLEAWARAEHYDFKTRTYGDETAPPGAVPHAHQVDAEHDPRVHERGRTAEPD